jgi:TRAP-type C4-dicarboxylate transport system permease small subunit
MRFLQKTYLAVLHGMAVLAGAMMVAMMAAIVIDVALRTAGTQSSAHIFSFTEYGLLLIPLLGAPWLVREKGHVYVEIFLMLLRPGARKAAMQVIALACVAVCVVLAWFGGEITVHNYLLADKDVRSFDMPRWILMAFMPLSFGMMAMEFLRFFVRGESLFGVGVEHVARELDKDG